MNAGTILVLPHSFDVQALSSKTTKRVFLGFRQKFFGNDQLLNPTPTRFLLGITENSGEFRIDLQNAVICVEQNDGFWHSRKEPVEEGPMSDERVQKNIRAFESFPHNGNPTAEIVAPSATCQAAALSLEITIVCAFSL